MSPYFPHPRSATRPLLLVACLLTAFMLVADQAWPQRWGPRPVAVKTVPVQSKAIPREVSFIGTIEPNVATTVAAVVAGRVSAAGFREGDAVTAGKSVLLQLDRGRREIALRERAAAVARAKKQWEKVREGSRSEEVEQRLAAAKEQEALLERARRDFERAKRLYDDQLVSLAELQKAESDYLAAREKYGSARAALKLTRSGARAEDIAMAEAEHDEARARMDAVSYEIEKSTLLAPISGFIVRKHVDVGDWVNAGEPVADLVDLDPVFAAGPVGERKIALLRRGQPATVALDAFPGETFSGEVAHIVPQADTRSRSFPVKIRLSNAQGRLKAGMLARIAVIVSKRRAERAGAQGRGGAPRPGRDGLRRVRRPGEGGEGQHGARLAGVPGDLQRGSQARPAGGDAGQRSAAGRRQGPAGRRARARREAWRRKTRSETGSMGRPARRQTRARRRTGTRRQTRFEARWESLTSASATRSR